MADAEIEAFLAEKELSLTATLISRLPIRVPALWWWQRPPTMTLIPTALIPARWIAVVSDALELNADALVVIKSTIPVGIQNHCKKACNKTA